MNIPHTNLDLVFKESLSLYKDKTLDFLGLIGIAPIMGPLSVSAVRRCPIDGTESAQ